jgi:hypothetical protein
MEFFGPIWRFSAPRILKIKSLSFFEAELTLKLGADKIRIQHALIVVGNLVAR